MSEGDTQKTISILFDEMKSAGAQRTWDEACMSSYFIHRNGERREISLEKLALNEDERKELIDWARGPF